MSDTPEIVEMDKLAKEYESWCQCDNCEKYRAYCKKNGILPVATKSVN